MLKRLAAARIQKAQQNLAAILAPMPTKFKKSVYDEFAEAMGAEVTTYNDYEAYADLIAEHADHDDLNTALDDRHVNFTRSINRRAKIDLIFQAIAEQTEPEIRSHFEARAHTTCRHV